LMMATTTPTSPRAGAERIDARDKVRGVTRYAADDARPGLLHAALVPARIPRGRITRIDSAAALRVKGVQLVLTHENIGTFDSAGFLLGGGFGSQSFQPMRNADIAYRGQPVALVVASTLEEAIEGAEQVAVTYLAAPSFTPTMTSPGAQTIGQAAALPMPMFADNAAGDAERAFAGAATQVDSTYLLPAQHQNPMELIATVAEWKEGVLTIHECSQNSAAIQHGLAKQLGIPATDIQVKSPTVGGGFGQKNSLQSQTALVAIAARMVGLPVKLVVPRSQIFNAMSFRPASRHRIRLGASPEGRIVAAVHETDEQTSQHDLFPSTGTDMTSRLYGIPNFLGRERLVRTDVQTPGYMRAPYEHPAGFAFESAVDELAYALGKDPVAMRLANDTQTDPISGKPFSSRFVSECLTRGAAKFGWARRSMIPGSMRAIDGSLIGWGMALGAYKAAASADIATVRLNANGQVRVSVGGHEMGQGMRSAIALTAARVLKLPVRSIEVLIGDTTTGPQPLTAGSWGTASALPPVHDAAMKLVADLAKNAGSGAPDRSALAMLHASNRPFAQAESRMRAPGQPEQIFGRLAGDLPAAAGPVYPEFVSFSFIAHFVEFASSRPRGGCESPGW
jgi:xanthine dehydrogenase YagR molybdenum-binding subunit